MRITNTRKYCLIAFFAIFVFGSLGENTSISNAEDVNFVTIYPISTPTNPHPGTYIVKNETDRLRMNETMGCELPEIDFNSSMVLAAFMKAVTGGKITIASIFEENESLKVTVKEMTPGENCLLPEVVSHPYHIVQLKKISKEIIFLVIPETYQCANAIYFDTLAIFIGVLSSTIFLLQYRHYKRIKEN